MFHQSSAMEKTKLKSQAASGEEKKTDRQRGMWSFLTWSFFLAQAVAANEALAKGHGLQDEGVASADDADAGANDASAFAAFQAQLAQVLGFDVDPSAAAKLAAAIAAGDLSAEMLSEMRGEPEQMKGFIERLDGGSSASASTGAVPVSQEGAAEQAQTATQETAQDGGVVDIPGGLGDVDLPLDVVIDLGLELGSDLGLDLGIDTSDGLDISLDLNALPILGLNLDLGSDGINLDLGLLGLNLSLGGENGGTLGGLLGGGEGTLLGGLPLGAAVGTLNNVTGLASDLLDTPLQLAGGAVSGTVDALGSVTQPVTSIVADVLDIGGETGLLGSGGSILQTAGSSLPIDALFSNGQHTPYGMEIQAGAGSEGAASGSGNASLDVGMTDLGALAADTLDEAGNSVGHLLPSVIDELNLRGFGDGIA